MSSPKLQGESLPRQDTPVLPAVSDQGTSPCIVMLHLADSSNLFHKKDNEICFFFNPAQSQR